MYVTVNLEQHRGQLPCQHTSLSSAVLLSWFTWLFAVLREPIPMFPRKPLSLSRRQTCASLVQVLGAVVGGLGSSFRSLTEWGPWGGWCNLTGFGGPRRRLRGAGGHLPLPHSCQRGAVGMGSGSTHCFSRPRLVSQVIFPVTAFSDSKTQTLGIGAFCPFCPEKTRLQSARCLCVGLEHAVLALPHGYRLGGGRESRHGGEQLLQPGAVLLPRTEGWSRDAGLTPDGGRQAACS